MRNVFLNFYKNQIIYAVRVKNVKIVEKISIEFLKEKEKDTNYAFTMMTRDHSNGYILND